MIAVWSQPASSHAYWASVGVNTLIRWEREADSKGVPTVSLDRWKASARAVGLKYVVEPSNDLKADAADPYLAGWLQPQDEPDSAVVGRMDANDLVGQEAVYKSLESTYAACKAAAPNVPVWTDIDLNQFRYGKPNYPRIFAACDRLSGDFYPIQRNEPVAHYADVLDAVIKASGGPFASKFGMAWIEASWQHLNPTYYTGKRGPTVAEFGSEINICIARNLSVGLFPQRIGEDGTGFAFRDWAPGIEAAFSAWAKPTVPPNVVTAPPLPDTLIVNGVTYDKRK